ncbi:hypothetical protein [Sphingomonas rhizophila]|uniref:hypothetical protein n=1 Tax=Sphingomonas rhizophila TaxID=2071607 RepID=UPI001CB6FB37|nr:hypothetical protein [Sphingomonas rhizophila]
MTVTLRSAQSIQDNETDRLDVDQVAASEPLVLAIVSENPDLARKAAEFLHREAGGELSIG